MISRRSLLRGTAALALVPIPVALPAYLRMSWGEVPRLFQRQFHTDAMSRSEFIAAYRRGLGIVELKLRGRGMITETKLDDGSWRYDGDGRTEEIGTSADGRYIHSVVHCGWVEVKKRLTDADISRLFGDESCSRVADC